MIGKVLHVDVDANGNDWGKYMQVLVEIDLLKPLAQGTMLFLKEHHVSMPFQYERLPHFCFFCGVIMHGAFGCLVESGSSSASSTSNL